MKRVALAPGYDISRIVKGSWQLAGGHGAIAADAALEDMRLYAEAGITTFDCADIYTGVEERIGAFRAAFPRLAQGVQVHTKYVPDIGDLHRLDARAIETAIDRSLRRLRLEALDLVQFHWWDYDAPGCLAAAQVLSALRAKGKIRNLGATNFDTAHLRELLDGGVPIVSHQVQYSLLDRRPAAAMTALCRERGVALIAYGAVLGGFFSERWLGAAAPPEPLENRSLVKYRLIIEEFGGWAAFQEVLRLAAGIGRTHSVSAAAVSIAFTLAQPAVAAVIAGARHRRHLDDTLAADSVRLDAQELQVLADAAAAAMGPAGDTYALERVRGGRHARIMKTGLNAS
jgi:aryl-alcohol dehydrogenase-like predicted oxidoreductase